jgi:hypothetical protein
LDREFLEDYEQGESEEIDRYFSELSEGKISRFQRFPPDRRFNKLHSPVTYLSQLNMPFWSAVAFSGSVIIGLFPAEKQMFEKLYRFKINQIDEIVSFAEETGKVQFVLMRKPTEYQHLEFLSPILERLRPPQIEGIPPAEFATRIVLSRYFEEFQTLADLGFINYFQMTFPYASNKALFGSYLTTFARNYVMIKVLAKASFSQEMEDALVSDYRRYLEIMEFMNIFLLDPLFNPLQCMECFDLTSLRRATQLATKEGIKMQNKPFPCELGKLLMRKLTHYPESLEACKQLIALYEEEDVQKLFKAVDESILREQPDAIQRSESELSSVLDNIWKDKSLTRNITGIRFGVPLALGVVGTVAAGLSGGYVGLLSGLGFDAIDALLQLKEEALSEKISKAFSSSQQVAIFDFQKKYSIRD